MNDNHQPARPAQIAPRQVPLRASNDTLQSDSKFCTREDWPALRIRLVHKHSYDTESDVPRPEALDVLSARLERVQSQKLRGSIGHRAPSQRIRAEPLPIPVIQEISRSHSMNFEPGRSLRQRSNARQSRNTSTYISATRQPRNSRRSHPTSDIVYEQPRETTPQTQPRTARSRRTPKPPPRNRKPQNTPSVSRRSLYERTSESPPPRRRYSDRTSQSPLRSSHNPPQTRRKRRTPKPLPRSRKLKTKTKLWKYFASYLKNWFSDSERSDRSRSSECRSGKYERCSRY